MTPCYFVGANSRFTHPDGMDESQVREIFAHKGTVSGGNLDGADFVVVAWRPSLNDMQHMMNGGLVYLTTIGGLPPHFISTDVQEAMLIR